MAKKTSAPGATPLSAATLEAFVGVKLPRLHVISDVHLERGPYELPTDLEYDILVAAGDIGTPELAVPWLAAQGKPVVYVVGNHEHYDREFTETVRCARELARGTPVHVLARNVVYLQGVRFLGTTLWSDFGNWNQDLVYKAMRHMRDYSRIKATHWWAVKANQKAADKLASSIGQIAFERGKFNPAIAFIEHQKDVAWLRKELMTQHEEGATVVVTHHAPTYESLRAHGVDERYLDPAHWHSREEAVVRVAAYASPVLEDALSSVAGQVDLWAHGHLHTALEVCANGVRVVANPRGNPFKALTHADIQSAPFFGVHLTEADVLRSQEAHVREPYRGDGLRFEPRKVIHFGEGLGPALAKSIAPKLETLDRLLDDTRQLMPFVCQGNSIPTQAVHRVFEHNLQAFADVIRSVQGQEARSIDAFGRSSPAYRSGAPLNLPGKPWPPRLGRALTRKSFQLELELMQAWRNWVANLPWAPATALEAWLRLALKGTKAFTQAGIEARVTAQRLRNLRELPFDHVEFCVQDEARHDEAHRIADALFNKARVPRDILVSVRKQPLWTTDTSRVFTRAQLLALNRFAQSAALAPR